jgi:hypothetical protein
MSRRTALSATATVAALASSALLGTSPAHAEAIVFKTRHVAAVAPGETAETAEHASIRIPTGYTRHKTAWHQWAWVENVEDGITISLDLEPQADTLRELRAERKDLATNETYEEFAFRVNEPGANVRAKWVFTVTEPHTGSVDPYVSVYLMRGGDRILVGGRLAEKDLAQRIRRHVVKTVDLPG